MAAGRRLTLSPSVRLAAEPLKRREESRGVLLTLSGLDGSGKTTAAKELVAALRGRGLDAVYVYAHRPAFHQAYFQPSFSIGFRAMWRRAGRIPEEFAHHPLVKTVYDLATLADHLLNQWRIFVRRRPRRILVVDRYVIDVLAYLRFLGPTRPLIERWLARLSYRPDVAVFFDIGPEEALQRKQEQTVEELRRFALAYSDLQQRFSVVKVDARPSKERVQARLEEVLNRELGIPGPFAQNAREAVQSPPQSRAD